MGTERRGTGQLGGHRGRGQGNKAGKITDGEGDDVLAPSDDVCWGHSCGARDSLCAPIGPSWPQDETTTLASMTLGSMQDWVSWWRVTSVQLVTTPPMYLPPPTISLLESSRTIRSSQAVALKSLMLGIWRARGEGRGQLEGI